MGGWRTWIEGVLYVSEVDADRQRWPSLSSLDRGPWTVDRGVGPFGRAVLSCAVRAVGRWVGAVRCGAVLWCRRSWVQMSRRSVLAALLGRRKKCGTGGQQKQEREQKLRLRLRSMQLDAAVVPIVEISVNRQERQSRFDKEGKGLQGGIKRKRQKMGV